MRYLIIFLVIAGISNAQDSTSQLTGMVPNPTNKLEQNTAAAFHKMRQAALSDGIDITIASGYRSFERQRQIWNNKYKRYKTQGLSPEDIFNKIVEYSTVPGTSRHHWGTDIDIYDRNATYNGSLLVTQKYHGDGPFCKLKEWMDQHSSNYGFELVYTNSGSRPGFNYEPWHYSYAPSSTVMLEDYLSKFDFLSFLRSKDILGMDSISDQRLEQYYLEHIQGINPALITKKN